MDWVLYFSVSTPNSAAGAGLLPDDAAFALWFIAELPKPRLSEYAGHAGLIIRNALLWQRSLYILNPVLMDMLIRPQWLWTNFLSQRNRKRLGYSSTLLKSMSRSESAATPQLWNN